MAKIYRLTDRIKVRIGDEATGVVLTISPLSQHVKTEVQKGIVKSQLSRDPSMAITAIALAMKHAIKGITGVEDSDGNKYQLTLDNGVLTDECVEDLLNMELSSQVMTICANLTGGVPSKFNDMITGKELTDVEVLSNDTEKKI